MEVRPVTELTAEASSAPPALRLRQDLVHPDPLLDSLVEACRLHGVAATRASLTAGLPLEDGRLTVELLERAAARAGMSARLQRVALARIDPATLPALLILRDDRSCVLAGHDHAGVPQLLLPETGGTPVPMPAATLEARYAGIALFLRPRLRLDARVTAPAAGAGAAGAAGEPGHWFWSAVLAQRAVLRDVLLAALLVNLFALAVPMFTMNVYDRVVPNHALETLWTLALGVGLVLLADLAMRLLRSRFVDEASARIDVQLSAVLLERVLGMRLEQRPASVGSLAANLRGFEQVRDFIAASSVTTLIDVPFALLFVGVIAWISPWLALPVLGVGAAIVALGWVLQRRLHTLAQTTYQAGALRNATLVESIAALETLKSQGAESVVQARWERTNAFLGAAQVRMRMLSARATYGTQALAQGVTVAVVVLGVHLIAERALSMGALIACSMLASRALAPAGQVVALLMQYQSARTALEGLDRLMAQPQERPAGTHFIQRPQLRGDIELRGVGFAYPGRSDRVLDGLGLRIGAGQKVAFIGRVGSGKSTILRLLAGLYQPTEGAVLLDGIDLRQLDPADLRRNQASVAQDVNLLYGSLRDNIALGMPYADDAAVLAAAELACLGDFVDRHPAGFEMQVGERGELLSGGQRQCVGIARAALHNAPILLLDEPTSAMDHSTEARITANLVRFARDKTVVLVTHRTSMLQLVDRVVVLDAGRIVADGPRDRILDALAAGRIARAA
ncbi:MAG: type I secretion system permease/ATPase [Burkholderiales bacterium]|nr:type I secretion system permease/ATPase [Burkholderiales bacterium]